ncbi:DUF4013 domain-containing protein [Anaerobaca lacustris]|uniref:DUF4013 domain-containing protein n=1 Tax=Anaerobaca lacustris TaxID=3044600 RepID=A0AAW6TW80_9BACT|nr:DUF4013 domain-containing protein [Sedimentisphaerales bacterium M17dextr]
MIEFRCSNCSQRLVVREDRAGRVSRCPRCKAEVTIPQASTPEPIVETEDDELTLITPAKPLDGAMLNLPDERELLERVAERQREEERLLTSLGVRRSDSHTGERRFIWPIDVLLYPTSGPGLTVLVLLSVAPLLLEFIRRFVPLVGYMGMVFLVFSFILGLYAAWYLAECIHDSARGGTRAPEFVGAGQSEMWSRVSYLLAVCIVYLVPFVLYTMFAPGRDAIFWGLAAYTLVFFPIGLLAMVVNDSLSALNPLFLLGSIFRTLFQYTGLLILLAAVGALLWLGSQAGMEEEQMRPFWLEAVGLATSVYVTFVLAHVLGRFYWHNADKLDWGL